ncbi:MAG: zinc ribbon domain-containing protein [Ilumatobacteraceae bacterium]
MIFIFGFRGRWSKRQHETGEFFCPRCGGDRSWVATVLRRWFTLFFIPIFPVGKVVADEVQCTTCQTRFDREALQQPTSSVLTAELQGSMRIAATTVVRAMGGGANPAAAEAVRSMGLTVYDDEALAHDVSTLDVTSLGDHLTYLAGALSLPGREQFLDSLAGVARASGGFDAARPTLEQIGQRLGLTPPHVAGVLAGVSTTGGQAPTSWPTPPPPALPPTDAPG